MSMIATRDAYGEVLVELVDVEVEERRKARGPFAVGPPLGVHLQDAQVHPELDFFHAVLADKFPHHHLARLVIPLVQQV